MSLGFGFSLPAYLGAGGGFGAGAAMSEDFTTGNNTLDPRITFSRTSNATLTGSNGLIQYAPHNLLTYSEQFDNAAWTKANASISANTAVAPDGTSTADYFVPDATLASHAVQRTALTVGTQYAFSTYAKAGAYRYLALSNAGSSSLTTVFDLVTGTAVNGASITSSITSVGNGWYRCAVVFTAGFTSAGIYASAGPSSIVNFSGDGTSGIYIWGAQLNVDGLQSYNPTTVKNLLGYTQEFDNAAWTKNNSFIQTNLLTYSQEFDNAAWAKGNTTISADTAVAPDGTTTADKLVENTTTTTHTVALAAAQSFSAGIAYTFSAYVKAGERYRGLISLSTGAVAFGSIVTANFNLQTETITAAAGSPTVSITSVGNGWYRLTISKTAVATASEQGTGLRLADATGATTYTGDGVSGFYLWGAQLVQGATAGDYQTTYGAAAAVQYTAPDGSLSADKLVENTATSGHYVLGASVALIPSTPYAGFVYAKAAERTQVVVQLSNAFTSPTRSIFDLSSGTVVSSTASVTSATITPVGNGWYLCGISSVCVGVAAGQLIVQPALSGNLSYTGDGTSGIYIWGAQLSDSASVDPYVYNPVAAPTAAAYYGPRFDYGYSISQNLLTFSEQFDNAAWTKGAATISANTAVAPDGTATADKVVPDATSTSLHRVYVTPSGYYTFSVYAKAGEYFGLRLFTDAFDVVFNLNTGTVASGTGVITYVGDGWYRCSGTGPITSAQICVYPTASVVTYAGNGTSGLYVWGAQLEQNSAVTTYNTTSVKNLLGYSQAFDNAAWAKSNSFIQTNLLTYSQQFTNAAWLKTNVLSTGDNEITAPDGSLTGANVYVDSAATPSTVLQSYTASTASYTFSVWLNTVNMPSDASIFVTVDGTNYTQVTGWTTNDVWFRTTVTGSVSAGTLSAGIRTTLPSASGALGVWGAQLVQGATAGDYQVTTTAAAAVQYTDPLGTATAEKLVSTSAGFGTVSLPVALTLTSGTPYAYTVYLKAGEYTWSRVQINWITGTRVAWFDLANGVVGTVQSGLTATITSVGSGWYRCLIIATTNNTTGQILVGGTTSNGSAVTGDGTSGIYVWGAQLADSASADPYSNNVAAAPTSQPVTYTTGIVPKGLLIEEQRTNLLTYSQEFDNAAWVKTNASISANVLVCPDGTLTADKLVEDTAVGTTHRAYQSRTCAASTTYSYSVYAKAGERTRVNLIETTLGGSIFDLSTGTVVLTTGGTAAIAPAGNGWYRCSIVVTTGGAQTTFVSQVQLVSGTSNSYTGDGVSGAYIWGAQLEAGAFATSYIPTVASTVTRAADSATMQGANFSNWYNQNNGTFYAEVRPISPPPAAKNSRFLETNDGTTTSRNPLMFGNTGGTAAVQYRVSGVDQATLSSGGVVFIANTLLKVASAYQTNDFAASFNGAAVITDTSGAVAVGMIELDIGYARSATTEPLNGWVSRIAYYNRRFANSELRSITS